MQLVTAERPTKGEATDTESAHPSLHVRKGHIVALLPLADPEHIVTGFGSTGPQRDRTALGPLIEAGAGLSAMMGYPDSAP